MRLALPCLILGLALTGCPNFDYNGDTRPTLGPVAVGDQIITADRHALELVTVSVASGRAVAIARSELAGLPSYLEALPDESGVLVLESDSETLERVTVPDGDRTTWSIGAAFGGLSIAPDATTAIA